MGIELDADKIPDMTAKDFMAAMISSPMITGMMQEAEITVGEVTIDGDTAKVEVTSSVMGQTDTNIIDVVREDGKWKVTEFGMNM
jgi:stress response protein SCP2